MTTTPPKVTVDSGLVIPTTPGTSFAMLGAERNAVESPSAATTSISTIGAGIGTHGPAVYGGLSGDSDNGSVTKGIGITADHTGVGASAYLRYQHLSDDKRTFVEMNAEALASSGSGLSARTDLLVKHKPESGFISPYLRAKFSTASAPKLSVGACVQDAVAVPMVGKIDVCAETRLTAGEKPKPRLTLQKSI